MSRLAKTPITLSSSVKFSHKVEKDQIIVMVEGKHGSITRRFSNSVSFNITDGQILVIPLKESIKNHIVMSGTVRSIVNSMIKGVDSPFSFNLNLIGAGYIAAVKQNYLDLSLGKSHSTRIIIPEDVQVECPKLNLIKISSINKESLGSFSSLVLKQRPANVYKGNGISKAGTLVLKKRVKKG